MQFFYSSLFNLPMQQLSWRQHIFRKRDNSLLLGINHHTAIIKSSQCVLKEIIKMDSPLGAALPQKNTEVQNNHRRIHTMTKTKMVQS